MRAEFGGAHPGAGTHNALLSLGETSYLEIIAPDPEQTEVKAAAKFFMDDPSSFNTIVAYAVHPNPGEDIEELRAILGAGEVGDRNRKKPDGSILTWRYGVTHTHVLRACCMRRRYTVPTVWN